MDKKKPRSGVIFYLVVLGLVLMVLYSGLRILESTVFLKDRGAEATITSRTIVRDGVSYYPRQDITVVMLVGIDQFGEMIDSGSYNNSGTCTSGNKYQIFGFGCKIYCRRTRKAGLSKR